MNTQTLSSCERVPKICQGHSDTVPALEREMGKVPALAKELFIGNWYFWETLLSKRAASCGLTNASGRLHTYKYMWAAQPPVVGKNKTGTKLGWYKR